MSRIGEIVTQMYDAADAAEAAYEVSEGEETPETKAAEAMWLEHSDGALESIAAFRLNLGGSLTALTAEKRRIDAAIKRVQGASAWCDGKMVEIMTSLGVKSRTLGSFQIRRRKGQPRVVLTPEYRDENIPECYLRCTPAKVELDKAAAKTAIKAGEKLVGVRVETGPDSVKIR